MIEYIAKEKAGVMFLMVTIIVINMLVDALAKPSIYCMCVYTDIFYMQAYINITCSNTQFTSNCKLT